MLKKIMKLLGKLIRSRIKEKATEQQATTNITNITNIKTMARKTVISKVLPANTDDRIIEAPDNKTLYADQFTEEAPLTDEDRQAFKAKNMKEVFEHYQPTKSGVALETEDGGAIYESYAFKNIHDFEDEQLIEQSAHLSKEKEKIDAYDAVIRQLEKNKSLRSTLKDPATRSNLKGALQALLAEIEDEEAK